MRARSIVMAGMSLLSLATGATHAQGSRVVGLWTLDLQTVAPAGTRRRKSVDATVRVVAKVNGQVINTGTRTISEDNRTMTLYVTAILANGQSLPIALVFARQGEAP